MPTPTQHLAALLRFLPSASFSALSGLGYPFKYPIMLKRNAAARGAGAAQSPTAGSVDGHGPASLYNSSSQQQQSGATPNFELSADGMFSAADVQLNEPTRHQPLHDLDQARDSRSRSVPPQSLFDRRTTDDTRRLPPIDTFQLPNSKRRNLFDESEKRPTSPQ